MAGAIKTDRAADYISSVLISRLPDITLTVERSIVKQGADIEYIEHHSHIKHQQAIHAKWLSLRYHLFLAADRFRLICMVYMPLVREECADYHRENKSIYVLQLFVR